MNAVKLVKTSYSLFQKDFKEDMVIFIHELIFFLHKQCKNSSFRNCVSAGLKYSRLGGKIFSLGDISVA